MISGRRKILVLISRLPYTLMGSGTGYGVKENLSPLFKTYFHLFFCRGINLLLAMTSRPILVGIN
jgi:hypothetical protein